MREWAQRVILVVALSACGRVGFDVVTPSDTSGDATDCWPSWREQRPEVTSVRRLDELGTGREVNPFLARDGLTLYFNVGPQPRDIVVTTRPSRDAPFVAATAVAEINSVQDEGRPTATEDALFVVFPSSRAGARDLWSAIRGTSSSLWETPTQAHTAQISTGASEDDPELTGDGTALYFAASTNGQQLYVASRVSTNDPFGPRTLVAGLESLDASDPSLSPDQLVITFSMGTSRDVYYATRPTVAAPFGSAVAVPVVNGPTEDRDGTLSHDGCELIFMSDRAGDPDLYLATLSPSPVGGG